jgi:hypothetical protein
MGGDNLEHMWYGLCLIKAIVVFFLVSVVVLLCKRFLGCIHFNRRRRPQKHPMVHPLGTVQSTGKVGDLDPGDTERRI